MKIKVMFQTPDTVADAAYEAIKVRADQANLQGDAREEFLETQYNEQLDRLQKWVEYSEMIEVEFDTEAMTAHVVERRRR